MFEKETPLLSKKYLNDATLALYLNIILCQCQIKDEFKVTKYVKQLIGLHGVPKKYNYGTNKLSKNITLLLSKSGN